MASMTVEPLTLANGKSLAGERVCGEHNKNSPLQILSALSSC